MTNGNNNNSSQWIALVATGLAGIMAGSLAFVSAVDARSFMKHVNDNEDDNDDNDKCDLVRKHFQVWWPCGRDYMVPLIGSASLAHAAAWFVTGEKSWAAAGLSLFIVGPYTGVVLGEDIDALRKSNTAEVADTTSRFCKFHHPRLAMALIGYGISLFGLVNLDKKK